MRWTSVLGWLARAAKSAGRVPAPFFLGKRETAGALGIRDAKCWEVINSPHQDAAHKFPAGPTFTLAEGTEEGRRSTSSPH